MALEAEMMIMVAVRVEMEMNYLAGLVQAVVAEVAGTRLTQLILVAMADYMEAVALAVALAVQALRE